MPYREHICPYKYFGDRPLGNPSSPFDDHRQLHKRHTVTIFLIEISKEKFGPVHRQFMCVSQADFSHKFKMLLGVHFRMYSKCNCNGINEAAKMTKGEKSARVSTSEKDKQKKIRQTQKLTRERKKAQWSGKRTDVTMDPHSTERCFRCLAILYSSESSQRATAIHCSVKVVS